MTEQVFDKEHITNEPTEDPQGKTQDLEPAEELLARELNVDESVPGTQHLDDELEEEGAMEQLKEELAAAKDKYIRLAAEFDNFRRRTAKERIELTQTAGRETIQALLVVLDDTDRAARQLETETDIEQIRQGVSLIFSKLRTTLQSKGLKKMESIHQPFDTDLHEAITEVPAPSADLVGKVIDEIEPGYYLNDKLIRHAKVIVGK